MPKLVIFPAIDDARRQRIADVSSILEVRNCESFAQALDEIADADGFYGKLTAPLLERATQLRWVQSPTASLEHYMFPELVAHPCVLSNMRGLFSDVIADHVMGYVLCFARNLPTYFRQQQLRQWAPVGDAGARTDFVSAPGVVSSVDRAHQHLADLTMGIVGVGAIGAEVARRAAAFGMTLLGVDPQVRTVSGVIDQVWPMSRLEELLNRAHYVVIAAPHTPETERMFVDVRFRQMRPDSVLINIGRGAIVALDDLVTALRSGIIRGAALDVCEVEPLPVEHPLWSFENVILTPHIAAASPRIAERHLETLLENVRRFVGGELPVTLVDKTLWY